MPYDEDCYQRLDDLMNEIKDECEKSRGKRTDEQKGVKMTEKWLDLYVDGRRMNRVIRFLETKFNKEQDVDKLIKLANSICYLTAQKITIVEKLQDSQTLLQR